MHPFFSLRDQLPQIQFDPSVDVPVCHLPFFKSYLEFYQLEFQKKICRQHYSGTFSVAAYNIVAHYWIPAADNVRGTIFILHGYYDHVGLFRHAIKFALEKGFVVVAYDQPGHGLSSGGRATIGDFSEYTDVLVTCLGKSKNLPAPWYGLGQSTGAAVLLHALMVKKIVNPFQGLILLAPLIIPAGWKSGVWSYRLLSPFIKKIRRHFSKNSNDPIFLEFCQKHDPLQARYLSIKWVGAMKSWLERFPSLEKYNLNILVIQGNADTTVDWRHNIALLKQKLIGARYCLMPSARHHLVNESEDLRQQIFTHIEKFLLASSE